MTIPPNQRLAYIKLRLKDSRFPQAELIEVTGKDKAYISRMWNGNKPVSEMFWKKFVEHYGIKKIPLEQESEIIKKLDLIIELLKKKLTIS